MSDAELKITQSDDFYKIHINQNYQIKCILEIQTTYLIYNYISTNSDFPSKIVVLLVPNMSRKTNYESFHTYFYEKCLEMCSYLYFNF